MHVVHVCTCGVYVSANRIQNAYIWCLRNVMHMNVRLCVCLDVRLSVCLPVSVCVFVCNAVKIFSKQLSGCFCREKLRETFAVKFS